jgi:hypothetical protein
MRRSSIEDVILAKLIGHQTWQRQAMTLLAVGRSFLTDIKSISYRCVIFKNASCLDGACTAVHQRPRTASSRP